MPTSLVLVLVVLALVVGTGLGYLFRWLLVLIKKDSVELEIRQRLIEARENAEKTLEDAQSKALSLIEDAQKSKAKIDEEARDRLMRLQKREELLDSRHTELDTKLEMLDKDRAIVENAKTTLKREAEHLKSQLERIGSISINEAKSELVAQIEREADEDVRIRAQKIEQESNLVLENKAKTLIATALQRISKSVASDILTTSIELPNDSVKGKIIGKEGRNIKAFERISGVELLIDESPNIITISSFDPERRYIAQEALKTLISDGRIQPARIEEALKDAELKTETLLSK